MSRGPLGCSDPVYNNISTGVYTNLFRAAAINSFGMFITTATKYKAISMDFTPIGSFQTTQKRYNYLLEDKRVVETPTMSVSTTYT